MSRSGLLSPSTWFLLIGLCFATAAAYWSGLSGPFIFDDYNNIVRNPTIRIEDRSFDSFQQAMFAGHAGPLKRPLSMASFAANYTISGMVPFPFKLTNLCIHLLNGLLVFLLSQRLLDLFRGQGGTTSSVQHSTPIALAATGVWMLHPMQLTSVLYVVQRMTSLSATFVLLGLLVYLHARNLVLPVRRRLAWLWIGVPTCTAVAALAKENGLLLLAFAFVIEVSLFRFRVRPGELWGTPSQFFALTLVLPLYVILIFLVLNPEWLDRAALRRPFTAPERLMTEARVMFLYVKLLLLPAITNMALFYDDFPVSRGLFNPLSTIWAIGGLGSVVIAALLLRQRVPWFSFAVLWFLAGHAMESTIVLLELIHPHRNYLAYLGPMLALTVGGATLLRRTYVWMPTAVAAIVLLALAGTTALRAYQWRNPLDLAVYEVRHRPDSARANYEIGRLLNVAARESKRPELNADAIRYLERASELEPMEISALIGMAIAGEGTLRPQAMDELQRRLRSRPLTPNQVGYLEALIICQRRNECRTPPAQIESIFATLLTHPNLGPAVKSDVLTLLAIYYAEQLGDLQAAERLMREAVSLLPDDPARYINLAQVLLFVPDTAGATRALKTAQEKDALGAYRSQIIKLTHEAIVAPGSGLGAKWGDALVD